MTRYVDLAYEQDDEGVFDLVIDEDMADFETTDGLESAIVVSLFSDRRAYRDEVGDPMKRRGWIGDLVSGVPGDLHGSGIWLYEQSRLTQEVVTGIRQEAEQALEWMIQEGLVLSVSAAVASDPVKRRLSLVITTTSPTGGTSVRAYELANATRNGTLARLGL